MHLPKDVRVEDFLFFNFKVGPPNQFNFSTISATVDNFPALNGLGFSLARSELEEGATVPFHTHPGATEVVIAGSVQGKSVGLGVFSSENPSIEVLDLALFGNKLDSSILQKTTFLDIEQIKKLKTFYLP
ncbi:hypothetical protein Lal_00012155 [Lupinus albus]|nr:hypothetical protein Lal_00012155 [Lupinus albus]